MPAGHPLPPHTPLLLYPHLQNTGQKLRLWEKGSDCGEDQKRSLPSRPYKIGTSPLNTGPSAGRGRGLEICPRPGLAHPRRPGARLPAGRAPRPALHSRLRARGSPGRSGADPQGSRRDPPAHVSGRAPPRGARRLTDTQFGAASSAASGSFLSPTPRPVRGSAPRSCPPWGAGLRGGGGRGGAGDAERGGGGAR